MNVKFKINQLFYFIRKRLSIHFGIILLISLQIFFSIKDYKDYGLHWDEHVSRVRGANNALLANQRLNYFFLSPERVAELADKKMQKTDKSNFLSGEALENYKLSFYGPFFELSLIAVELLTQPKDYEAIFYTRHLVVRFTFLIALFFFYLLIYRQFQDWRIGIAAVLILLLCPRIYGHSFFNNKDIPFLSICILITWSHFRLANTPTYKNALLHAFLCAIAIDIRIVGLIFTFLTGLLYLNLSLVTGKWKRHIFQFCCYSLCLIIFTIAFWPYLWKNPLEHFLYSLAQMSKYPWDGNIVFLGQIYQPINYLPWYYFPVWFIITIPLIYWVGFLASLFSITNLRLKSLLKPGSNTQLLLFSLFLFLAPWFFSILKGSVLYDGWRHFYFVYPYFVIISIYGFVWLLTILKISKKWFYFLLMISSIALILKMINLHPYQHLYTNILVGKPIEKKFDLDYWGISYKKGLQKLIQDNPGREIKLAVAELPGEINLLVFPELVRKNIKLVSLEEAQYFMTIFREVIDRKAFLNEKGISEDQKVYSVEAAGDVILSIYRLK